MRISRSFGYPFLKGWFEFSWYYENDFVNNKIMIDFRKSRENLGFVLNFTENGKYGLKQAVKQRVPGGGR